MTSHVTVAYSDGVTSPVHTHGEVFHDTTFGVLAIHGKDGARLVSNFRNVSYFVEVPFTAAEEEQVSNV